MFQKPTDDRAHRDGVTLSWHAGRKQQMPRTCNRFSLRLARHDRALDAWLVDERIHLERKVSSAMFAVMVNLAINSFDHLPS